MNKTVKKVILGAILGPSLVAGGIYVHNDYNELRENATVLAKELKETQKQKEQEAAKRIEVEKTLNETKAALDKAEKDKASSNKEVSELKNKVASLEQELSFKIAARQEAERQAAIVEASTQSQANYSSSGGRLTPSGGVFNGPSGKETYYSQRILPGGGLNIPGRHVAADETIRDAEGYIVIASDVLPKGSITQTSLGTGKVYDTGVGHAGVDIYTNW